MIKCDYGISYKSATKYLARLFLIQSLSLSTLWLKALAHDCFYDLRQARIPCNDEGSERHSIIEASSHISQ